MVFDDLIVVVGEFSEAVAVFAGFGLVFGEFFYEACGDGCGDVLGVFVFDPLWDAGHFFDLIGFGEALRGDIDKDLVCEDHADGLVDIDCDLASPVHEVVDDHALALADHLHAFGFEFFAAGLECVEAGVAELCACSLC